MKLSHFMMAGAVLISSTGQAQTPPAFLKLLSEPRKIRVVLGAPERVKIFNLLTQKSDIPNLLSPCRVTPVEIVGKDPVSGKSRKVKALSFAPKDAKAELLRTVLLMPPTGGQNPLDDAYAVHLCERDLRVVIVQNWEGDDIYELDLGMHDRGSMRAVASVKDVIEFLQPRGKNQIGILGTSVGAISAALILGTDSRVAAGVLIVGGAGMPEIIATSAEKNLTELRDRRLKNPKGGMKTVEEYQRALEDRVKIEPLDFAAGAGQKKVMLFIATKDITVPTANQYLLADAFENKQVIAHDANHFNTILYTAWNERDRIAEFFLEELTAQAERP